MATQNKSDHDEDKPAKHFEVVPSELDEKTHAEVQMLYTESTETMRFIKSHQWKTVGATLITYLGLVFIAGFVKAGVGLTDKLMGITILIATTVIFILGIYQLWMHNEMLKIERMSRFMSNVFKSVRAAKSRREANVHRYLLLAFMIVAVMLGAIVVHLALHRIAIT